MLSTTHRMLDGIKVKKPSKSGKTMVNHYILPDHPQEDTLYKAVHFNHPCTVWTRESLENYEWHYRHFIALCDEYKFRYGKIHLSDKILRNALKTPPKNIPNTQNLVYMMYIGFGFPPWPLYCFYDMLLVFPQTNVQLAIIIWCVCCVGALPSSAHTTIPSDLRLIYMPRRSASLFPVNEPFLLLIVVS